MQDSFITAEGLSQQSPRIQSYHDVNLGLAKGQAHAICAEDRSGKTELLLTLAGRMLPTSGTLRVGGIDVRGLRNLARVRRFASLGFFENVNEVERVLKVSVITSAELGLAGKRSNAMATNAFLENNGLLDAADTRIEALDRYTFDWLGIALGMAHDPKLLVVDDIESSLTEHQSLKLVRKLKDLARSTGVTVACGVNDYDIAVNFDSVSCISDEAHAQEAAWTRKHVEEVA